MADRFFTLTNCERCGATLADGRIMSMYSTECICLKCKEAERKRKDYREATEADHAEIAKGNFNFKGIGWKK
jgi:recombinational DNA repair protein (RecF pathway)